VRDDDDGSNLDARTKRPDDDENTPLLFLSCDGSNLDARTKCTDDNWKPNGRLSSVSRGQD
jgi:hypothetical protein